MNTRVDAVIKRYCDFESLSYSSRFIFGSCRIGFETNSRALHETLQAYFHPWCTDLGFVDVKVVAFEQEEPELGLSFVDWKRESGKKGRKEEIVDFVDGRVVRKVRTGMQFFLSEEYRVVIGSCTANANQVINFINMQYMNWRCQDDFQICHAAGVVLNDVGFGISAKSGGGKSTLALFLMNRGATFVSNDRVLVRDTGLGWAMSGIPKMPRVNPGTLLNNPKLKGILPEERRSVLGLLGSNELWMLEEKYDVDIEQVYGQGMFTMDASLEQYVVLDWDRDSNQETSLGWVTLGERPDLLPIIMKSGGPFFEIDGKPASQQGALKRPDAYLAHFGSLPVGLFTGRVDFEFAADALMQTSLDMRP